ncbi:MAG: class I SAM-dependent methyltransferase [Syntrophales bacterium]
MKILVTIANHGTKNMGYFKILLNEYRSMPFDTDIVVLSNIPKDLGSDVEVIVGCPTKDPWSLPFGHKRVFSDRVSDYDLFIYSEDDTLITERNVRAFLRTVEILPKEEIAGFIRYELDESGKKYYSTIHSHFHWIPSSVKTIRDFTFARFTNDHSACYLLTQEQLRMAIASGGFLVDPHQEKYDLLVTAATDPYTQCGLTKVICVSHLEDFCLHHLPNQYIGKVGVSNADLRLQLDALTSIASNGKPSDELFKGETALKQGRWSKSYYEEGVEDLIGMMPSKTKNVLSIGCGRGATESILVEQGIRVTAVPLDSVIGACALARGVEITPPDSEKALDALRGRSFDCILFMDVLEHLPDPVGMLSRYAKLLTPDGVVLMSVPNFNHIKIWRDLLRGEITWRQRYDFEKSRLHFTTMNVVKRWLKRAGIKVVNVVYRYDGPWRKRSALLGGGLKSLLASKMVVMGKRVGWSRE